MPALPLDEAGKYIAGAYVVFFALIALYIAIIGAKVARIERQVSELLEMLDERDAGRVPPAGETSRGQAVPASDPAGLVEEGSR
jgi:hypothetical protein